jgi:aerobic-type carbon monoxide dehydrogenase small subunit (CoxS/CutS family)
MRRAITISVNGETHDVVVGAGETLLRCLRDSLRLTGTKEGCGNGNCGSCTVLLGGEPVNACLVLAEEVAGNGLDVVTIEGLSEGGRLHPVQEALIAHGGTQCGFCTPGIVISAAHLLARNASPDEEAIRHAIAGNICRCTGYDKIVEAVAAAIRPGAGA